MKRALALRSRTLPSALYPWDALALQSWRDPNRWQQTRPESTAHISRFQEEDLLKSADLLFSRSSRSESVKELNTNKRTSQMPNKRIEKSSGPLEPPPARRRLRETSPSASAPVLKDTSYIHRTLVVPTAKDYPHLPPSLFSRPKERLNNAFQGSSKFKYNISSHGNRTYPIFRCEVSLPNDHDTEVIETLIGEGRTKKSAEEAAFFCLLAKLHETKYLDDLFAEQKASVTSNDNNVIHYEGKADIYNYAARFSSIPKFRVRKVQRAGRTMVEVTVELAEQDILVTSRGPNLISAEIAAAARFKKAAENFHAKRGEGPIVIKESTALTASNARKFIEYYKTVHPRARCTVDSRPAKERKGMGDIPFKAQVIIDGEPIGEPVEAITKKRVEDLAFLTAAVVLSKKDPGLHQGFLGALKDGNGEILPTISPNDMIVDDECALLMRETLFSARQAGLPDEVDGSISDEAILETRHRHHRFQMTPEQAKFRNIHMQNKFNTFLYDERLKDLRKKKSELPMNQYRAKVLDMVSDNTYSIIVGATGSGKTTQVPQILLENAILNGRGSECNIICTQPRRIAATSVARRVSEERAEKLQDTVGYQVRFDTKLPATRGSITYCTTGILLQQLQNSPDEVMQNVSYLIIDEVHERDIIIDFLLIVLKRIISERASTGQTTPKVVLMSATIDTEHFASYFRNNAAQGKTTSCPTLYVPGRNFPVKERFLDEILDELEKSPFRTALDYDRPTHDYLKANSKFCHEQPAENKSSIIGANQDNESLIDWKQEFRISENGETINVVNETEDSLVPHGLITATIAHIVSTSIDGAVLVFLPGLDDIVKVDKLLREKIPGINFNNASKFKLLMLHSSIPTGQTEVFDPVPLGCRKIILSTNIAETSVTIPDVQFVVDTGKMREIQYDQTRRISQLQCTWISKSSSKQRAGRAGRVQNGNYYALFPKARYNAMRATGLPEILRSDLQKICLDVKAHELKLPIRDFLAEAIDPPPPKVVDVSVRNLQALDALTENEELTPLGRLLSSLPVHPSLGKMIVLGVLFRCLDPMLILGAASGAPDIFLNPIGAVRSQAQKSKFSFVQGSESDHIGLLNAVHELREHRRASGENGLRYFAMNNFLSLNSFKSIENTARQIEGILVDSGLIPYSDERHQHNSLELGSRSLNENSSKFPLIRALALAGMHPNLAISMFGRILRTPGEKNVLVHPSSVNAPRDRHGEGRIQRGSLFTYGTMARSNDGRSIYLRHTTKCTPLMAVLFGGRLVRQGPIIQMDGWLPFWVKSTDHSALKTIMEFRKGLNRLLAGAFQDLRVRKNPVTGEDKFLADEQVRKIFAAGLVDVLASDVRFNGFEGRFEDEGAEGPLSMDVEGDDDEPGYRNSNSREVGSQAGNGVDRDILNLLNSRR